MKVHKNSFCEHELNAKTSLGLALGSFVDHTLSNPFVTKTPQLDIALVSMCRVPHLHPCFPMALHVALVFLSWSLRSCSVSCHPVLSSEEIGAL